MKKRAVFLILLLLSLVFFACEFKIPTAIEFIGSPKLDLIQTINVGEKFTSILADEIKNKQEKSEAEDMIILACDNTEIFTDIIYMELFNQILESDNDQPDLSKLPGHDLDDILQDLVDNNSVLLDKERDLVKNFDKPMEIPLSSVGTLLEGFDFTGYKIKLYVSGSSIVDIVNIDITFKTIEEDGTIGAIKDIPGIEPNKEESDIETWKTEGYKALEAPSDGIDLEGISINGKDLAVYFRVYIPVDETLYLDDLTDGNIKIEVVVWLPFMFEATEDGATITFPDDALFSSEKDLFGREKPDEDNMMVKIIQSLNLEIKFDTNPFNESKLIVYSKGIVIENELQDDDSFPFIVSEENMKKINSPENWPFTPNFKMEYSQGKILTFPRTFNAIQFIFNADMKYRMDL